MEFQRVTRVPKFQTQKAPFPNFSSRPPPFGLVPNAVAPHSADSAVVIRVCSPNLNFVSQNSSIAQIPLQRKIKGECVVGQFEFSTSDRRKPKDRRGRNAPNMAVQPMVAATPKQTFS